MRDKDLKPGMTFVYQDKGAINIFIINRIENSIVYVDDYEFYDGYKNVFTINAEYWNWNDPNKRPQMSKLIEEVDLDKNSLIERIFKEEFRRGR